MRWSLCITISFCQICSNECLILAGGIFMYILILEYFDACLLQAPYPVSLSKSCILTLRHTVCFVPHAGRNLEHCIWAKIPSRTCASRCLGMYLILHDLYSDGLYVRLFGLSHGGVDMDMTVVVVMRVFAPSHQNSSERVW